MNGLPKNRSDREMEDGSGFARKGTGRMDLNSAWKVVRVFIGLVVLFFVGRYLYLSLRDLLNYSFELGVWIFIASLMPLVGFYVIYSSSWVQLLHELRKGSLPTTNRGLLRIFFLTFVSRYIPAGKITNIGGRIELFKRAGGDRLSAVQSFILEQFNLFAGAFLLSWVALWAVPSDALPEVIRSNHDLMVLVGALLPVGFWLAPYFLSRVSNVWTRARNLFGRIEGIPAAKKVEFALRYLLVNLLQGVAILIVMLAIHPDPARVTGAWLLVIAAYPLSRVGGQLVTVVPGGLGVREGLFTYLVAGNLGVETALITATLFRITSILFELCILGGLTFLDRKGVGDVQGST